MSETTRLSRGKRARLVVLFTIARWLRVPIDVQGSFFPRLPSTPSITPFEKT